MCFSVQFRLIADEPGKLQGLGRLHGQLRKLRQNVHAQSSIKFLRFLQVFMYFGNKLYPKKPTKILIKCSRYISSISVENRLISYISYFSRASQLILKSVTWRCSVKKVFYNISQNSQENGFAKVSPQSQKVAKQRHATFL